MNKELLIKYAGLMAEKTAIEEQLENIKPLILDEMATVDDKTVELQDVGIISVVHKKSWRYSEAVEQVASTLKSMKKKEEADGTATYEETRYPQFRSL